jgi:Iron-containing redox enzyme
MKPNEFNHSLAPNLQPVFSKPVAAAALAAPNDSRALFYELVHISEHYAALPRAYLFLKQHFQSVNQEYTEKFSAKYSPASLAVLLKQSGSSHPYPLAETSMNECMMHYAPIYYTESSWLATIVQTVTSQAPLAIDLMAVYSRLTTGEHSIANSREIYSAHLLVSAIELPAVHTIAFAKQPEIGDEIFDFAALQLALGQFPRVFFPEILGFTLSYCQSDNLLGQFFPQDNDTKLPSFVTSRNNKRKQEVSNVVAITKAYLAEFPNETEDLWQRVQTGFWLYQQQLERCDHRLTAQLHATISPRQAMEKLLSGLMPNAIGHHGKIRIGGKTIDEWFKETPFKSANFLATLLHSPYVDRVKPENSKLLQLYEFNGPMFGVLDENGKEVVKNWLLTELNPGLITSKKHKATQYKVGLKSLANNPAPKLDSIAVELDMHQIAQVNYANFSNRELYYYLVNSDLHPEVLSTAKQKVNWILTWAKRLSFMPFKEYSHQVFDNYIKSIYQHEVDRYKPVNNKPTLSKDVYVWGIEQFAPTILTDGSWLQGIHLLDYYPNHNIAALLHKIYKDETGNGILAQNHPHIYQELLASLAIKLPPIESKDFINHPRFLDSAFDIPVYLMAISKFPNAFLPELLGLNMAIEISGLGRAYLRLSEELKFWGIQSAIVDIHTSIDNLASGHSALAVKAIQGYLDEISACYGEQQMHAHWRRIYTGYCSLRTASLRFKFSLIKHYYLKRPSANTEQNTP